MGGSKKPTTGYKFHMYLHMIFCLGPVDAFRKLLIGDREAWSGNQTVSGTITVEKPSLFGGDEREGGIVGELDVMMGDDTQSANAHLTLQQGAPQPGYRGLFGLVFRGPSSTVMVAETVNVSGLGPVATILPRMNGHIGSNNPYIKGWAALVRRIISGWRDGSCWYPEKAAINLPDGFQGMNPAHIVYQVLTDPEVGRGLARASILDANFRAAADAFHAEGLGLTLKWTAQTSVDAFIQIVADHAGFNLIEDRDTGLFRIVLLRNNYTIGTLPTFNETEVRVRSAQRPAPADFVNEIVVKYTDVKTGKDASTTVQNLAAIQAQGRIVSQVINYPGLPTQELANRTGIRDLMAKSSPLWRFSLTMSRKANSLVPGEPFVFNYPPLGVNLVLRPGEIDYGNSADGEILAEVVEDVFALPLATYITPQTSGWIAPDPTPQASTAVLGFEVPYRSLAANLPAAELTALPLDAGYVAASCIRPPGIPVNFALYSRMGSVDYQRVASGDFAPSALLTVAVIKSDTPTVITVSTVSDAGLFTVGGAAFLGSEMVQIRGINFTTNQITIGRGCGDTTPQAHAIGARLWLLDGFGAADENQYISTETVNLKLSTIATGGELAIASAPVVNVTLNQRAARPYPPAKLTVNTLSYPTTTISGDVTLGWQHRDRVLQQDQLIDQTASSIGPETGTTYTARYYKPVNTLVNTQVGIAGASAPAYTPSGALENMRVTVESVKSGLASWQILEHTFMSQPPAFIYLDEITPLPRSVLSIKKLISTATLSIRVRRSNDNVEQDIGFTGNALNTAALSTFVGANTAYLVTAYDQTGNLQHAVQATASKQPRIVNAGTYDGKLVFDGIDDALTITVLQNTGTSCAVYSKLKQSIGGAAKVIFESSSNTNLNDGALVFYSDASNYGTAMNDGPSGSTVKINRFSFDLSVMKQASILFDRTLTGTDEIKSWVAGVALTPTAELTFEQTGNFASFDSHIGARAGTSLYADMELETFVFYNTDTSAVRSSIEALI